jgi:predicted RNA-binding Zn ribbon-like protein
LPSWVQSGETKPAPMPLLLVQAFVNTWDADAGRDLLREPDEARRWLGEAGLGPGDQVPDPEGLRLARDVREGIRALLTANGGGPAADPGALRALRGLSSMCRFEASVGPDGRVGLEPVPVTVGAEGLGAGGLAAEGRAAEGRAAGGLGAGGLAAGGLAAGLFRLVLIMRDAQLDGTWPRLKACRNPDCRWAFYDRSHSRRGAWCDMASCGNRLKNRALRQRQKA